MNKKTETTYIQPKTGYDTVFSSLKRNNIFGLDDQDKLPLKGTVDDGTDYMLQYKIGDTCRSYSFNNPEYYKKWNKNLPALDYYINIVHILFDEFANKIGR